MTKTLRRGIYRAALDNLVEARTRQAQRYVAGALLTFDDKTLAAYGYDRETLRRSANSTYL
jgi:hypothetical protein